MLDTFHVSLWLAYLAVPKKKIPALVGNFVGQYVLRQVTTQLNGHSRVDGTE